MAKQGTEQKNDKVDTKKVTNPAGQAHSAGTGSPTNHNSAPSAKGSAGTKVGCQAKDCRAKDKKFEFCDEHFRQFKFGLITKKGDPVSDYEKKLEHYEKWSRAQKVA